MIFLGTHGINWIGEECGGRIKALNHGRKIKEFIFHPTERNWGLATAFTLCEDFVGEPCKIYKELFVTRDLGETWDLLESYIVQFNWGVYDESTVKAGVPKERILITYEPRGKGDQKHQGWDYKVDFVYSDDFFKTRRVAAHKGNKFMITRAYIYVAQVVDVESQEVMLLRASTFEKHYDLLPIETNQKKFREHSYTFLDTSEHSVFLHMNHFGDYSRYGHVYISDARGVHFSQSLKYNVRSIDNQCDFEKINSLEGVYVANAISSNYMRTAEQEIEKEELEAEEGMEANQYSGHTFRNKMASEEFRHYIKTMISFNKGGDWKRIKAPERDFEGKRFDCGEYCYLNLHGISSDIPPFYSVETAAGIIIANGNVGRYLSQDEDEVGTYLSRDGGINWFHIKHGAHIYEIGDHGALIVLADNLNPSNVVHYSWDEGMTFEEIQISDEKIYIKNIIIEPTSTSQHFIVYGDTQTRKGEKKGVVIGLDFTGLHEPQCRNPDSPDTEYSDYEKWTPSDAKGNECLLGRKVTYIRRKRDAKCFNGLQFEKRTWVQNCECTEDDYECDVGYRRVSPGEPCTPEHSNVIPFELHTPPADCKGYYTISKGYRKVPGNSCVNGVRFDPIVIPCPYTGIFAHFGMIFFFFIVIILIVLIVIAFNKNFFQNVSEIVKEKFKESASMVKRQSRRKQDYVNIVI